MNKKRLKTAEKKQFNQLSGAPSTQKLIKIHSKRFQFYEYFLVPPIFYPAVNLKTCPLVLERNFMTLIWRGSNLSFFPTFFLTKLNYCSACKHELARVAIRAVTSRREKINNSSIFQHGYINLFCLDEQLYLVFDK